MGSYECRKQRRKQRLRILLAGFFLSLAGILFAASRFFQMDAWEKLDMSKILEVDQSLIVYDVNGDEVTTLHAAEDRIWVPIEEIPLQVRNAFVSAEDARFYEHFGIDIIRIFGAAWADIKAGAYVQGASTISQQLVKLSHLTAKKEMSRKLEEAVLAYQLERLYSKDEILEMYLNYVYFGGGYYGIEAAARGYFGVHAKELTIAQSAQLAGILKSPSNYAPHLDMESSIGRRNVILSLMHSYGYISGEELEQYENEPVMLVHGTQKEKRGYYVDLALTESCRILSTDMQTLLSNGYRIETAMHPDLQRLCEEIAADESNFPDKSENGLETAIAIVDVNRSGIAALIGGRNDSAALGFNRATMIRRQPGSVIKPILVYAPALEAGYTAATMLLDEQIDYGGYSPSSPSGRYLGWVTMRDAVTNSLNVPAVTVMAQIGVWKSKRFAERLGIEFDARDTTLALALGGFTYGVSPLQVADAYATFARSGVYSASGTVQCIKDPSGKILYQSIPKRVSVMRSANAYVLTSMLQSVVKTGTGRQLSELNIPIAAKTGTTGDAEGNRDIWMAAYNPEYAGAVWIGYDDNTNGRMRSEQATGGTYPAQILKEIFALLYAEREAPTFPVPVDVREYRIDRHTLDSEHVAVLASGHTPEKSSYSEVFMAGTEPKGVTSYWQIPDPPKDLHITSQNGAALIRFTAPNRFMLYRIYREDTNGKSLLLSEVSGADGIIQYTDDTMKRGVKYTYYVIPVHPVLEQDQQQMVGAASVRVEYRIDEK